LELLGRHHQLFGDRRVGLSITSLDRSRLLPEVPTVREAGLPEAETEVWIGLFAPARTPDAVIATL
jgi:tripartite-type tricarboxylate transporter receptor subunit TctC